MRLFAAVAGIVLVALAGLPQQNTSIVAGHKQLATIELDPGGVDIEIARVVGWQTGNPEVVTLEVQPDGMSAYVVAESAGSTWVLATIETTSGTFLTSAFQAEVLEHPPPSFPFGFAFSTQILR